MITRLLVPEGKEAKMALGRPVKKTHSNPGKDDSSLNRGDGYGVNRVDRLRRQNNEILVLEPMWEVRERKLSRWHPVAGLSNWMDETRNKWRETLREKFSFEYVIGSYIPTDTYC